MACSTTPWPLRDHPKSRPSRIIDELRANGGSLSLETRSRLAALAYTRTAAYDLAISSYLASQLPNDEIERLEPLNPLGHLSFFEIADEADSDDDNEFSEYVNIELA